MANTAFPRFLVCATAQPEQMLAAVPAKAAAQHHDPLCIVTRTIDGALLRETSNDLLMLSFCLSTNMVAAVRCNRSASILARFITVLVPHGHL